MLDDLPQPTDELERHLEIRAARVANQMMISIVARFSGVVKRENDVWDPVYPDRA
jgi:hypothetical protein